MRIDLKRVFSWHWFGVSFHPGPIVTCAVLGRKRAAPASPVELPAVAGLEQWTVRICNRGGAILTVDSAAGSRQECRIYRLIPLAALPAQALPANYAKNLFMKYNAGSAVIFTTLGGRSKRYKPDCFCSRNSLYFMSLFLTWFKNQVSRKSRTWTVSSPLLDR